MPKYLSNHYREWDACWIWNEEESKQNSYAYFRKSFDISCKGGFRIFVTADTRYKLYINGVYINSGPIQSQSYCMYYDEYNISEFINEGINTIAFIVYYGGHIKDTRGGLLAEVLDDSDSIIVRTDDSWKTKYAYEWSVDTYGMMGNKMAPYQEHYNATKETIGWMKNEFNDSQWSSAYLITSSAGNSKKMSHVSWNTNDVLLPPEVLPWCVIRKREIPYMREYSINIKEITQMKECLYMRNRMRPYDLSIGLSQVGTLLKYTSIIGQKEFLEGAGDLVVKSAMDGEYGGVYTPYIVVDFGKVITAYFEIEVEGVKGQQIEIGYGERLVNGEFNNAITGQFADSYILKNGKQTFRSFNWRGYRYVKLVFKNCMAELKIKNIKGIINQYPFEEKGKFYSNNTKLNQVFDICRYTIQLCSNESIMDTPWREQAQWLGDVAAVTMGGIYACFGDTKLPGKFIQQSASNQFQTGMITNITNVLPFDKDLVLMSMIDYNLWWVISVWNQYMYTGETKWIMEYYPVISKMMMNLLQYVDEYGMLNRVPYYIFIDWSNHDKKGESAALNAIYYGALNKYREMAIIKKDEYMIELCDEIIELQRNNFELRFYDKELQVFSDSNDQGKMSEVISETTNMLAIYFELVDKQKAQEIVNRFFVGEQIKNYVKSCPFMSFYTLKTLTKMNQAELALQIIEERWYKNMVEKGAQSTYEEWGINGSWRNGKFDPFMRSSSHAWSAGPAEFLLKELVGIEIVEAGCTKISVHPHPVLIDYDIIYPIPQGEIVVNKYGNKVEITIPQGVELV